MNTNGRNTGTAGKVDEELSDGTHKLPVRADVRKAIGKGEGDTVTVRLQERL